MRKMKDSGIEWIGEIPDEWEVVPTKRIFRSVKNIVRDDVDNYERLALTMNGVIKRSKEDSDGLQPEKFESYQILKTNNLVFKLIDLENIKTSRVGLSPYTGLVSPAYIVIENEKDDNRFYYYYFMFLYYFEIFNHLGGDGVRSALNSKDLLSIPTIEIPYRTQQHIASYLDEKCAQIDRMIERQQSVIEKLKEYKQSIQYEIVNNGLDNEASNWTCFRLGDIGEYKKGPFGSAITISMFVEKSENTYKIYEQKNAIYHDISIGSYYITREKFLELINFEVKENDIIVSCAGTIGECYLVPSGCEKGIINQALMRIRIKNSFNIEYILVLLNVLIKEISNEYSNGSAIKNIPPFNILKKVSIKIPNVEYQDFLVKYIKLKCCEIDHLTKKMQEKIEKLYEYKKSLIYEAVTGKIEV